MRLCRSLLIAAGIFWAFPTLAEDTTTKQVNFFNNTKQAVVLLRLSDLDEPAHVVNVDMNVLPGDNLKQLFPNLHNCRFDLTFVFAEEYAPLVVPNFNVCTMGSKAVNLKPDIPPMQA